MARATAVPITPAVLRWAIDESGYSVAQLAAELGVAPKTLNAWLEGRSQPTLSEARPLARALRRPLAALLLPAPPASKLPRVQFRHAPRADRRTLTVSERLHLREAGRLQDVLSWVYRELKAPSVGFTQHNVAKSAADVAAETRRLIRVDVQRQLDAKSNSEAFHLWREATEAFGVHVLVSSMGQNACRGFSVWDEYAPMIVVNSAWNVEARTFTLLHELGHLLTRTSSLCLETGSELVPPNDDTERWCEIFAAALLLPEQSVREHLNEIGATDVTDLGTATRIARKYRVSLRAATLRLISLGVARWPLYRAIPAASDRKREGGGGGGGRTREEIRRDHFGVRTFDVFGEALRREVLTYGDVVDYLDAPSAADAGGVLTLSGND